MVDFRDPVETSLTDVVSGMEDEWPALHDVYGHKLYTRQ